MGEIDGAIRAGAQQSGRRSQAALEPPKDSGQTVQPQPPEGRHHDEEAALADLR
jgi:hypothetical protein